MRKHEKCNAFVENAYPFFQLCLLRLHMVICSVFMVDARLYNFYELHN